ncbi:centromere/kinetochore protein zw10 homolog [Battus philenor]|uniref:centromere/kinetochore protein zw10 homolog n=1 Tax=Battus philenor TaxID=42288 RepID=UPI0035CFFEBE
MTLLSAAIHQADKVLQENVKEQRDALLPNVKDLTERVQLLSWALQQNFIDTYCNFTPTKSLEQLNYQNRKSNILSDYEHISKDIKILEGKSETINEEFCNSCKKLENAMKALDNFCIVVEGKDILNDANHEFGRYNYTDAILSIKNLRKQLSSLKFEGNTSKALATLNSQAENQLALYAAQLSIEWEDIFTWEEKKSYSFLIYSLSVQQNDTILKQNVLKSLQATERLNAELGLFSHFFIDKLLHNIIRYNCEIYTDDHLGAVVYNIKIDLNDTKTPNFQTIFNNLTATFDFLKSTLEIQFENNKTFIQVFADSIREKFFSKVIEDCIRNNLPSCDSSYDNYKSIVLELDAFNKFLIDLKFVEASESPLNKYIDDAECILYSKKCDKLLSDVRSLLSESLSHGTLIAGNYSQVPNDSLFDSTFVHNSEDGSWGLNNPIFLPKCVISQNVQKIISLIIEHLEESIKLPEKYRRQLIIYIKDIAVMYQCLVPKKFKVNLEFCSLDIALYFNNCYYLAHSLLGPPWKNILPWSLADLLTTILLESIQDLRVVGLEKISLYLETQKNIITKKIEETELPWTHESYQTFDVAINSSLNLMNDLKSSWLNILPLHMYELSICTLVQALCQAMLDRMLSNSKPTCEKLVYMLAQRFEDTVTEIESLFVEKIELASKINIWIKFIKMSQLLKAQPLQITELWKSDEMLSQNYVCEEIRQIVKIRFPDDKYRLKILKEIQ